MHVSLWSLRKLWLRSPEDNDFFSSCIWVNGLRCHYFSWIILYLHICAYIPSRWNIPCIIIFFVSIPTWDIVMLAVWKETSIHFWHDITMITFLYAQFITISAQQSYLWTILRYIWVWIITIFYENYGMNWKLHPCCWMWVLVWALDGHRILYSLSSSSHNNTLWVPKRDSCRQKTPNILQWGELEKEGFGFAQFFFSLQYTVPSGFLSIRIPFPLVMPFGGS